MKIDKNELIKEINKEQKKLEKKAFKLYCKEQLKNQLEIVEEARESLFNKEKRLNQMTIEELYKEFNRQDYARGGTPKEIYMKGLLSEKKN